MAFLALFVGLSDMFGGYDRYIYGECFDRLVDTMRNGGNIINTTIFRMYGKEFGYVLLNMAIGLFTANRYIQHKITLLKMFPFNHIIRQ